MVHSTLHSSRLSKQRHHLAKTKNRGCFKAEIARCEVMAPFSQGQAWSRGVRVHTCCDYTLPFGWVRAHLSVRWLKLPRTRKIGKSKGEAVRMLTRRLEEMCSTSPVERLYILRIHGDCARGVGDCIIPLRCLERALRHIEVQREAQLVSIHIACAVGECPLKEVQR